MKRAHHFSSGFCDDPTCGLHIIAKNEDDSPICEIIMSVEVTVRLIENTQRHLYEKATIRSERFNPPKEGREP